MKRYLLQRILFSIFSLMVVTGVVMFMTYNLMDRTQIFLNDTEYNKRSYNEKTMYIHNRYQEYGYETYENYSDYVKSICLEKYGEDYAKEQEYKDAISCLYNTEGYGDNQFVKDFTATYRGNGYTVDYLAPRYSGKKILSYPYLIAYKDINLFQRFGNYLANFFSFETIWDVKDPNLKAEDRYIRWEWDARSNMPALVGNGTTHKYLIYFDDKFPFVHQNIFRINLGKSNSMFRGIDTMDVLNMETGETEYSMQEWPSELGSGILHEDASNFHTVTYSANVSDHDKTVYGENEHYVNAALSTSGLTRLGNSFVIGIIATIIAYILGLPLGIWMARRKDKLVDKLGNAYIIFIMAVPSLAYIFIFAAIGTSMGLPFKWANASSIPIAMILPIVSLALPSIGGLMKWVRRYMIDQSNSDYVKFARSTGMTEGEIFRHHISRNAFIYIVHNIPADILFAMTGALITERVYAVPGVGGLLTNAINAHDNGIIIAGTIFYATLSIVSLIAGDLLLAKYDPRVSLSGERG